jgi:hypothetical protein
MAMSRRTPSERAGDISCEGNLIRERPSIDREAMRIDGQAAGSLPAL